MRGIASWKRGGTAVCLVAVAVALGGAAGCSRPVAGRDAGPPPNIVLVVLDTLRADHLSCYGYERKTSPNIDRLAEGATLYRDCVSTSPWTLPAHASMFTGKYPFEHGAYPLGAPKPGRANAHSLPLEQLTLAEFLHTEGFETAAFVANAVNCGTWTRLDQGFDSYFVKHVYAEALLTEVFAWLEHRERGPFFLFINLMDTHRPYNVSPRPGFLDPPADPDAAGLSRRFKRAVLPATKPVPQELRRKVIDQYDTAIANVDEQVGRLLNRLKTLGLFDEMVVVITSDHGEYFGEHFLTGHAKDVYQPVLSVPLIIKGPGQRRGGVEESRVSLVALPNLICAYLPPAPARRSRELFPEAVDAAVLLAEKYPSCRKSTVNTPWGHRFSRARTALFFGPHKYIRSSDDQHELYDLARDPNEHENLLGESADIAARLARALDEFMANRQKAEHVESDGAVLSEEELRMMAELGYIDGPGADAGSVAEGDEGEDD
jgi:arylsulfatase A-like enzyme